MPDDHRDAQTIGLMLKMLAGLQGCFGSACM
jgi:hypothetical protein